ncbi:MAG: hypothetical protein ACRCZP_11695 [Phycicoccus sp.]
MPVTALGAIATGAGSSGATLTLTTTTDVPVGGLIVLAVGVANDPAAITCPGFTQRRLTDAQAAAPFARLQVLDQVVTGAPVSAGSQFVVSGLPASPNRFAGVATAYTGLTATPFDVSERATSTAGTTTLTVGPTPVMAQNDELVVTAVVGAQAAAAASAVAAGYTVDGYAGTTAGSNERGVTVARNVIADATQVGNRTAAWTFPGANNVSGVILGYRIDTTAGVGAGPDVSVRPWLPI